MKKKDARKDLDKLYAKPEHSKEYYKMIETLRAGVGTQGGFINLSAPD